MKKTKLSFSVILAVVMFLMLTSCKKGETNDTAAFLSLVTMLNQMNGNCAVVTKVEVTPNTNPKTYYYTVAIDPRPMAKCIPPTEIVSSTCPATGTCSTSVGSPGADPAAVTAATSAANRKNADNETSRTSVVNELGKYNSCKTNGLVKTALITSVNSLFPTNYAVNYSKSQSQAVVAIGNGYAEAKSTLNALGTSSTPAIIQGAIDAGSMTSWSENIIGTAWAVAATAGDSSCYAEIVKANLSLFNQMGNDINAAGIAVTDTTKISAWKVNTTNCGYGAKFAETATLKKCATLNTEF